MLYNFTIFSGNKSSLIVVLRDINSDNTRSRLENDFLIRGTHVRGLNPGLHSGDESFRSADEGSLLLAIEVSPSSVFLKGKAITFRVRLVSSPVSEREVLLVGVPSPELNISIVLNFVASTDPNFISSLNIVVGLERVVLIFSVNGSEYPSLLLTVVLGTFPGKSNLGGEVPDVLLSRFTSLIGPHRVAFVIDSVRVSVLANSNSTSGLTGESEPVVASGVISLSLNEFPDSHVAVSGLVLSDNENVTRRTGSDIHSFSSKFNPLLSRMVVVNRSVDVVVLTCNPRLSIEFNSNSVSVTRSVSVNVEFTFSVQESGFTSGISDPDLSVSSSTNIGCSHSVGFPFGVSSRERLNLIIVSDNEDFTVRGDSNSLSIGSHRLRPGSAFTLVNTTILTSNINLTIGIDIDIRSSEFFGSVFPGDGVFFLARSSSQVSLGVVREDSSRAGVEDKSHGGNGVAVNSRTETNKGLRLFIEELFVFVASSTDFDFLSTNKSKFESSSDLSVTDLVPVVDSGDNFTFGFSININGLASMECSIRDSGGVDFVVEVVESESHLGDEILVFSGREAVGNLIKLRAPVDFFVLDNIVHIGGVL